MSHSLESKLFKEGVALSPALTSAGIKESASLYPIIDFVFVESIVSLRRKLWHFQIVVHIDDSGVFLPINRFDICPSSCAYRNLDNLKKLVSFCKKTGIDYRRS